MLADEYGYQLHWRYRKPTYMSLLALLISLLPVIGGVVTASALRLFQEKTTMFVSGAVGGIAFFVTLTYLITLVLPFNVLTLAILACATMIVTIVLLATTPAWVHWRSLPTDWFGVAVIGLGLALCSVVAPKLLIEQTDGLYTGVINAYGDIAWHMANITAFAEGQSLPPQNPIFAGTRLTYPFLSNFFSAMLLVGKATFTESVALPAVLLIPLLLGLVYTLTRDLADTPRFSPRARQWAGLIAVALFLFGGATFGWVRFWGDWQASAQSLGTFLTHLPNQDYSGVGSDPNGFHFLNPVTTLLLPQRSFLFGLPLALLLIGVLLRQPLTTRAAVVGGVIAGLLPLFHAHTVVALIPVIVVLFLLKPSREWLVFALVAGIVGVPEVTYYLGNTAESGSFLRFDPGWTADQQNIVWFWFKNTGLLIPAAIAGLFLPLGRRLKLVAVAGFLIFTTANLWLFAPWAWDNFKLLVFWLLLVLPIVSYVAVYVWQLRPRYLVRAVVIAGIAIQITSAALDVWKLALPTAATWNEWDTEGMAFAKKIRQVTKPGESVLTAPIHNTPVVLAGRPLYLGYAAHVWSHGGLPWEREKAIPLFYEGTIDQLPETRPQYVMVGPVERQKYPLLVIRPAWRLVATHGTYALYELPITD